MTPTGTIATFQEVGMRRTYNHPPHIDCPEEHRKFSLEFRMGIWDQSLGHLRGDWLALCGRNRSGPAENAYYAGYDAAVALANATK